MDDNKARQKCESKLSVASGVSEQTQRAMEQRAEERRRRACEAESIAATNHVLRCNAQCCEHEQAVLQGLQHTWLGSELLSVMQLCHTRRRLCGGYNTPLNDCLRARRNFVIELNTALLQTAAACAATYPEKPETASTMPFRLPHPLPPYIMIFHTPGIRGKDRSFGVGWASSSCVIKNLCRAMAPQNGERVDMLNRNLAQFEDFVAKPTQDAADRSTSRSVLFVFSMHALRSIDTAHWTMHSLEIDGAVIARHVSAGVEQRELSAAPKRGNGGTAGKGKQRDKSRLAMAGLEKRIVDDSALFWSTDDNCVLKGAPTLSTCAKTSPECVAVTTADGHRNVYEMPSQKELAVFRDATRAVDLDPASEATADAKPDGPPGLNAGSGTGDGDGGSGIPGKDSDKETRMRRLVHELQRLNRAAEDKLTAERERGEAERKRLVAEHMHDLGELRKQLQEARDTALEHARNTKVLVDDAKRAETDAQAALRDSDAQLKQERARAGQLERDLEDTRAKLHTARGEREVARGKCKELQRQQTRNAETFNTATTTLKQQVSALSKDLEDQKRGRKAESVQHAAELQACQAKHDEAVEWRRLAQQETDGAIAKLTERLDEAEKAREVAEGDRVATLKLVERLENEARTAPPAAHAETQTPAPPPAAPAFSVQVVELEKRFSHLYEAYVKDVGRNPPEIPAPPAGSDHAPPATTAAGDDDGTTATGEGVGTEAPLAAAPAPAPAPIPAPWHSPSPSPSPTPSANAADRPISTQFVHPTPMPALPTTPSTLFEVVCSAQQSMMALVNVCHSMASERPDYGRAAVAAAQSPAQRAAQLALRPSTPATLRTPAVAAYTPMPQQALPLQPHHQPHQQPRGGRGHKPPKAAHWTDNGQYHGN